ncbi:MAG: serine/threonine protein kinase, partial [Myxococcales bacterium]|nr:serine/threonine protein kinase [Myxococcales bacterium]
MQQAQHAERVVTRALVEGQDLRRWCAAGPRSWRELREVYVQAAQGLAAAHAVGLVHRDFKPDNVIVGPQGRARVGDFGLARPAPGPITEAGSGPSSAAVAETITSRSTWAGTPAYMAPEVLEGRPADPRSDQYSLCVAFYEALAGRHPHPAATVAELVARIEAGRIEPPRDRSAPGWLLAVLARGMSRKPEDRFDDVPALLVALRHDRRVRARAGASLGVVALVGATTGGFWLGQGDHEPAAPCTGAPAVLGEVWNETTRTAIADAMAEASPAYGEATAATVLRAIDAWGEGWVDAHRSTCEATHVRGEQSEARLDLRMGCLRGELRQLEALAGRLTEASPEVVEHAVDAVAMLPALERCADVEALTAVAPPPDEPTAAAVRMQQVVLAELGALVATGQFAAAEAPAEAGVDAARALDHAPLVAEARLLSAHVLEGLGRLDQARDEAYEALWAAQRAHDDEAVARAWLALLGIAGQRGRWDEAAHLG